MKTAPAPEDVGIFLCCVVLAFILISFLLSQTGWSQLARYYTTEEEPCGQCFSWVSAYINGASYRGGLFAYVSSKGLWLQPYLPYQLNHPALLIPWLSFTPFELPQQHKGYRAAPKLIVVTTPEGFRVQMLLGPDALMSAVQEHVKAAHEEVAGP